MGFDQVNNVIKCYHSLFYIQTSWLVVGLSWRLKVEFLGETGVRDLGRVTHWSLDVGHGQGRTKHCFGAVWTRVI